MEEEHYSEEFKMEVEALKAVHRKDDMTFCIQYMSFPADGKVDMDFITSDLLALCQRLKEENGQGRDLGYLRFVTAYKGEEKFMFFHLDSVLNMVGEFMGKKVGEFEFEVETLFYYLKERMAVTLHNKNFPEDRISMYPHLLD